MSDANSPDSIEPKTRLFRQYLLQLKGLKPENVEGAKKGFAAAGIHPSWTDEALGIEDTWRIWADQARQIITDPMADSNKRQKLREGLYAFGELVDFKKPTTDRENKIYIKKLQELVEGTV